MLTNVVATEFIAKGAQVLAQGLRSSAQATVGFANRLNDVSRQSSVINNQWRAMATTIRYAIAGQAVFGLTRMIGQLKDVQTQLGLIQAIGSKPGPGGTSVPFTTRDVNTLGNALQGVSMNTITPVNQINDAAINLLSTVQNLRAADIPSILTSIGQAAQLSQTPIESLTQAATTMNIAFGRANSAKNISEFTRMWYGLIQQAPGGIRAAPELAQQLPNISTIFQQGLSPKVSSRTAQAQMMSLVLASTRFGATPSTAMRGLQYFLQSLETPASNNAKKALMSIGITPTTVRKEGIYATTLKFLQHISGNLTPTQLKQIQAIPEDQIDSTQNLPGVAPQQMAFLRTSLGRVHAVRAAIVLASQLRSRGGVGSLNDQLNLMLGEQNNEVDDVNSLARAWKNFRDRSKLQEASVALNNLSLDMAKAFEPLINLAASPLPWAANVAQHHRHAATRAFQIGGTALAVAGILSFIGGRGRGSGRIAGGLFGGAQAARSLADPSHAPIGSMADPIYVRTLGGPIFGGKPVTPGNYEPPVVAGGGKGFWGKVLRYGGPVAAAAGITQIAADYLPKWAGYGPFEKGFWNFDLPFKMPSLSGHKGPFNFSQLVAIQKAMGKDAGRATGFSFGDVVGQGKNAELTLNINLKNPDGTVTHKKIHVPASLWANGKVPTSKGTVNARR